MRAAFFKSVRASVFGGRLTTGQVEGTERILDYLTAHKVSRLHQAYILATIFHETAAWMQPIREGARRYGTAYTDAQSRRAVASIYAKGIIRWDYSLPDGAGNSFYGRGLVQITHKENYAKFGIADTPEKALEWDTALDITVRGMQGGMFTSMALGVVKSTKDYYCARAIINGDTKKNGAAIAALANSFYEALEGT